MPTQVDYSALMNRFRQGDSSAAEALVTALYPELRRLAVNRMRSEDPAHTWQPTVLVNELYLELRKVKQWHEQAEGASHDSRKEFLALAAFLMRRLLAHHARPLRKKAEHVPLEFETLRNGRGEQSLQEVEDLLNGLSSIDTRLRHIVELKVFHGLTVEEIANRLHCSVRTVARDWSFARHWLQDSLSNSHE